MTDRSNSWLERVVLYLRKAGVLSNKSSSPDSQVDLTGLSIKHNFVWTLAGNLIFAACQWSVVVVLAKIGSSDMVGQFALAVAVAFPITLIANLQLRVLFVTDHQSKYAFDDMLGLRLVLSGLAIVIILLTCAIARYGEQTTRLVLVIGTAQLVDCISENYYGISQRYERMDRIARSQIFRSVLSLGAVASAVYYTHNLIWAYVGVVFARGLVLVSYDASPNTFALAGVDSTVCATASFHGDLLKRIRPGWNVRNQLQMAWTAFPLAIAGVLVSVNGYLPRYVLESDFGRRELGIYAAISYIPVGCFMATTALAYAVFARLSKLFARGELAGFRLLLLKTAGIYGALGIAGFLLVAVAGRQILTIMYRPEYAEHADLLRWLMIAGTVQCLTSAVQAGLTAAGQFRVQVPLFGGVAVVSLIACLALVPRMGLDGAALAVIISSVVQLSASTFLMFRTMAERARQIKGMECPQLEPLLEVQR